MKTFTNYADGRTEARAWLAHQLAWERVLTDLRNPGDEPEAMPADELERPAA